MKKESFLTLLVVLVYAHLHSQTTQHGIDANWYQFSKTAATITGTVSVTNYLTGAVANNMVVKHDGTVIIFYREKNGTNVLNKWIQSSDNGNTWTSPGNLVPAAVNGMSTIAADTDTSENIYILWKSGHFALSVAKYNGSSWSTPVTINTTTQNVGDTIQFSQITVDRKGRIHLMWQQGNHQNYSSGHKATCWYARSTDGGQTFTKMQLSNNSNNYHHAAFPVADFGGTSSDTLMIAWRQNVNGVSSTVGTPTNLNGWNWDVKARISYDGGVSWNPVFTLAGSDANDSDDDQWDPNVVIDKNGVLHVFYHVYHNNAFPTNSNIPDFNAKIRYEYSTDGGNSWQGYQLSTNNIRSHLVKTAYDYMNNYVWCVWKDEMDFDTSNTLGAQADLKAVYVQYNGITHFISNQEFITDCLEQEVAYHNFKVGLDGIMRASYNIAKPGVSGGGDTLFYTQRNSLTTSQLNSYHQKIAVFPNPTHDYVYFNYPSNSFNFIKIYDSLGKLIFISDKPIEKYLFNESGVYYIILQDGDNIYHEKIIKN